MRATAQNFARLLVTVLLCAASCLPLAVPGRAQGRGHKPVPARSHAVKAGAAAKRSGRHAASRAVPAKRERGTKGASRGKSGGGRTSAASHKVSSGRAAPRGGSRAPATGKRGQAPGVRGRRSGRVPAPAASNRGGSGTKARASSLTRSSGGTDAAAPEARTAAPLPNPVVVHHNRKVHLAAQAPAAAPAAKAPAATPPAPATPPPGSKTPPQGALDPGSEDELLSGEISPRSQRRGFPRLPKRADPTVADVAFPGTVSGGDDGTLTMFASLGGLPSLYDARGALVVPAPMRGSHDILVHQNFMADADGLQRISDDAGLAQMRASGALVAVPTGPGLRSDERLPANRRFCRPWTAEFLRAVAKAHFERFGTPLQVNSAVRTVEFQQRLARRNGNAAPAVGETASPHLTGQAVDLAKKGLSLPEIAWMRTYLLPLVQQGKIDVEEEFQQSCFHISIYRQYGLAGSGGGTSARGTASSTFAAAFR